MYLAYVFDRLKIYRQFDISTTQHFYNIPKNLNIISDYDLVSYPDLQHPFKEWFVSISLDFSTLVLAAATLVGLSKIAKQLSRRSRRRENPVISPPQYSSLI